jgi:hypothetical protein
MPCNGILAEYTNVSGSRSAISQRMLTIPLYSLCYSSVTSCFFTVEDIVYPWCPPMQTAITGMITICVLIMMQTLDSFKRINNLRYDWVAIAVIAPYDIETLCNLTIHIWTFEVISMLRAESSIMKVECMYYLIGAR